MEEMDQIYNEMIMEHSMSNKNRKPLERVTSCLLGHNPNCGDEIKLEILLEDGKIVDAAFSGHGCAISQSSTSITSCNLGSSSYINLPPSASFKSVKDDFIKFCGTTLTGTFVGNITFLYLPHFNCLEKYLISSNG